MSPAPKEKPKKEQKSEKEETMQALLNFKASSDMINDLIEILNAGHYPLSILNKVPKVVDYVHDLKRGTNAKIEELKKKLA